MDNNTLLDEMFKNTPKKNTIVDEIVCIVDRSGSMGIIQSDAEGGLNAFIEEQRKLPSNANLTLVEFDDKIDTIYHRTNIKETKPYKLIPRGMTALVDAIGRTLHSLADIDEKANVTVVIVTDGAENSSREFTRDQVFDLISGKKAKGWNFLFLAANQDAIETGATFGFDKNSCATYTADAVGTRSVYAYASNYTTAARTGTIDNFTTTNKIEVDKT